MELARDCGTTTRDGLSAPFRSTSAEALLDALGIDDPSQIRLEAIAQFCGVTIVYQPLQGSEARLIGYRDRAIVTINQNAIPSRQRFSAAHELGHWMWDRGKMAFTCDENELEREWNQDNPERRANRFAADLLLPLRLFQPLAAAKPPTFGTLSSLAGMFQTSLTATAIRYVEFSSRRIALVGEDAGRRCWVALSPGLRRDSGEKEIPRDCEGIGELLGRLTRIDGPYRRVRKAFGKRALTLFSWPS